MFSTPVLQQITNFTVDCVISTLPAACDVLELSERSKKIADRRWIYAFGFSANELPNAWYKTWQIEGYSCYNHDSFSSWNSVCISWMHREGIGRFENCCEEKYGMCDCRQKDKFCSIWQSCRRLLILQSAKTCPRLSKETKQIIFVICVPQQQKTLKSISNANGEDIQKNCNLFEMLNKNERDVETAAQELTDQRQLLLLLILCPFPFVERTSCVETYILLQVKTISFFSLAISRMLKKYLWNCRFDTIQTS